ncbi:hypothetical protein J542_3456 [Acinetobacter baumannii 299505]|nr:hypothetical protein J542_3456 [Acinetobacter baumannii 299505]
MVILFSKFMVCPDSNKAAFKVKKINLSFTMGLNNEHFKMS